MISVFKKPLKQATGSIQEIGYSLFKRCKNFVAQYYVLSYNYQNTSIAILLIAYEEQTK